VEPARPSLLVESLVAESVAGVGADPSVSRIVNTLLLSPTTDAERAGERLRVFGWERDRTGGTIVWTYRVVGEHTGLGHLEFALAVDGQDDVMLSVFGLQLQIALNGIERTPAEELDCFLELIALARRGRRDR
jgi:hypothetical protein